MLQESYKDSVSGSSTWHRREQPCQTYAERGRQKRICRRVGFDASSPCQTQTWRGEANCSRGMMLRRQSGTKAPPPPAWRDDGGAWGEPVEAPPLPEDGAKREGYLAVQRHELIVVERGLQYLPLFLGSTLMQQLGVTKISMPRNRIRELHCFELAPAVGCRSLIMLKELRMPGNGLRYLPDDIGLPFKRPVHL